MICSSVERLVRICPPLERRSNRSLFSMVPFRGPSQADAPRDASPTRLERPLRRRPGTRTPITDLGKKIKRRIRTEIGEWISCSIGVGTNRLARRRERAPRPARRGRPASRPPPGPGSSRARLAARRTGRGRAAGRGPAAGGTASARPNPRRRNGWSRAAPPARRSSGARLGRARRGGRRGTSPGRRGGWRSRCFGKSLWTTNGSSPNPAGRLLTTALRIRPTVAIELRPSAQL
jgi:hypothetical protein